MDILIKTTVFTDLRDSKNVYGIKILFHIYHFYFVHFVNNIKCFLQGKINEEIDLKG